MNLKVKMALEMVMANQTPERLSRINELAVQAAQELGLILLDLRFNQQDKNKVLAVTIYRKESPTTFVDCEQMSRALERLLEQEEGSGSEFIKGSYLLEVVSPGIERQLTSAFEYNIFAGKKVRIVAKKKIASLGAEFIGNLVRGDEQSIVISQAQPIKSSSKKRLNEEVVDEINLDLQEIYRVYLWAGS